jgi:hypothetical protein
LTKVAIFVYNNKTLFESMVLAGDSPANTDDSAKLLILHICSVITSAKLLPHRRYTSFSVSDQYVEQPFTFDTQKHYPRNWLFGSNDTDIAPQALSLAMYLAI